MPDLRYHVVSLISVFLALAVGVLLGIAMADNGVLDEQLRTQVSDIRADLQGQRSLIRERDERIAALERRADEDDAMLAGISEAVVSNRLEGRKVALVLGPYADDNAAEALQNALALSGATLTSFTKLEPPGRATADEASSPEQQYAAEAADVLAPTATTDAAGVPGPEVVVFLGGGDAPPGADAASQDVLPAAEAAMFRVWQGAGVRIVGAESSRGRSQVARYNDLGIPSVDNADRPAGRAALVLLAAGAAADGAYGTKPTASDPFPPVPG